MRRAAFRAAVAAVALAAAGPVAAQLEIDPNAPVEISADEMEWKNEERVAVARGNADAVQGPYHLHADRLTAHLSDGSAGAAADRIRLIEADGNVRLVTPGEVASGARGAYDVEQGLVFIEGDVVLTQGANVVRGDRLDMNLGTGVSRMTAGASRGGRVAAVFAPGSDENEDGDEGATGGADE